VSQYDVEAFRSGLLRLTPEGGHASIDKIYDKAASLIHGLELSGGTVLDYGSGVGNFTRRLIDLGTFDAIFGADIKVRPSVLTSVDWLQTDLNQQLPVAGEYFDCLVSLEVIEHLENPRATVRDWFRVLKPGGVAIFSTPNNESWQSVLVLLTKGHFKHFVGNVNYWYPGGHITALLRMDIERILAEVGFVSVSIEYIASTTLKRYLPFVRSDTRRTASHLIVCARRPP